MTTFEENGIIERADIEFVREVFLACTISLRFDGSGQGFGGEIIGGNPFFDTNCSRHDQQKNLAADFIGGVMAVAEVDRFSDLEGKVVRVRRAEKYGSIIAIGHPIKDLWYEPKVRLGALTKEVGQ